MSAVPSRYRRLSARGALAYSPRLGLALQPSGRGTLSPLDAADRSHERRSSPTERRQAWRFLTEPVHVTTCALAG